MSDVSHDEPLTPTDQMYRVLFERLPPLALIPLWELCKHYQAFLRIDHSTRGKRISVIIALPSERPYPERLLAVFHGLGDFGFERFVTPPSASNDTVLLRASFDPLRTAK